jgi:hypothetical protein
MHEGKRWRMNVDLFAMARGATERIEAKQTAERIWEPKFVSEIVSGRDPHVPPNVPKTAVGVTVADFLDLYFANYVEAEGLRDPVTIKSRLKAMKETLGDLPVTVLEKPAEILRFKGVYRKGREVATVNRALSHASRSDQLGPVPRSAVPDDDSASSIWCEHQDKGGNQTRPQNRTAGRAGTARRVLGDEWRRA